MFLYTNIFVRTENIVKRVQLKRLILCWAPAKLSRCIFLSYSLCKNQPFFSRLWLFSKFSFFLESILFLQRSLSSFFLFFLSLWKSNLILKDSDVKLFLSNVSALTSYFSDGVLFILPVALDMISLVWLWLLLRLLSWNILYLSSLIFCSVAKDFSPQTSVKNMQILHFLFTHFLSCFYWILVHL